MQRVPKGQKRHLSLVCRYQHVRLYADKCRFSGMTPSVDQVKTRQQITVIQIHIELGHCVSFYDFWHKLLSFTQVWSCTYPTQEERPNFLEIGVMMACFQEVTNRTCISEQLTTCMTCGSKGSTNFRKRNMAAGSKEHDWTPRSHVDLGTSSCIHARKCRRTALLGRQLVAVDVHQCLTSPSQSSIWRRTEKWIHLLHESWSGLIVFPSLAGGCPPTRLEAFQHLSFFIWPSSWKHHRVTSAQNLLSRGLAPWCSLIQLYPGPCENNSF